MERAQVPPLAPGLRHTRQRQLVWDAVHALGGHCSAEEITLQVQRGEPGLARSTVYRALDALASSGALHAVRFGEGPVHYEVAGEDHQHAVCQVCGGVLHIEHELVADLESHLEARHHFTPMRTDVVVIGVCSECARARPRARTKASGGRRRNLAHVHHED
ncbi:MAG TPA: Fur family transcriptional regulator [Candidatus Nitrosotalea sp.]|nr:Fur family transcriptional regulator [Candidatus Nitrosotalea sp.]